MHAVARDQAVRVTRLSSIHCLRWPALATLASAEVKHAIAYLQLMDNRTTIRPSCAW
jgi:hypothetical protein